MLHFSLLLRDGLAGIVECLLQVLLVLDCSGGPCRAFLQLLALLKQLAMLSIEKVVALRELMQAVLECAHSLVVPTIGIAIRFEAASFGLFLLQSHPEPNRFLGQMIPFSL